MLTDRAVVFLASGDLEADRAALGRLCQSIDAVDCIQVLYVGPHHVTGFGAVTAKHHIANDIQVKQEVFPVLKKLCDTFAIPADHIHILLGDPSLTLEKFVRDREVKLIAIMAGSVPGGNSLSQLTTALLGASDASLLVVR